MGCRRTISHTCLEFAATAAPAGGNNALLNETLTLLINAMKEKPITEEVKSINQDILTMRSHHSLSEKAAELGIFEQSLGE